MKDDPLEENKEESAFDFSLTCQKCNKGWEIGPNQKMVLGNKTVEKAQSQMAKELIEVGIMTTATHKCADCNLSMCIICSVKHKEQY